MSRHLKKGDSCWYGYKQSMSISPVEIYHKSTSKRFYIPDAPTFPIFSTHEKIRLALHYEDGFHILKDVFDHGIFFATLPRDKDIAYQTQEHESKSASPPGVSILHHELYEEDEYLRQACGNKSDYVKDDNGKLRLRCYKCMIIFKNYSDLVDHMKESYAKMVS